MKTLLIRNPGSRSGRGRRLWSYWERALREAGADFGVETTEGVGHAVELARQAEAEVVVAVGGDGTINEVLDGVAQAANPALAMGVLYAGTSPDFCRFHRIPVEPRAALQCLLRKALRRVDVVQVDFTAGDGRRRRAHFGCSANIGLGAAVARCANRRRRYLGDALGTGSAALSAIFRMRPLDLELEVDGEPLQLPACNHLSVVRNPHLASGLKLDLALHPADGKIALFGVQGRSVAGFLRLLPGFYSGSVVKQPNILLRTCSRVTVSCFEPAELEFDGDPRGWLPAAFCLLPTQVSLICQDGNDA